MNDILYKFTTYENIDKEYEVGAVCFVAKNLRLVEILFKTYGSLI